MPDTERTYQERYYADFGLQKDALQEYGRNENRFKGSVFVGAKDKEENSGKKKFFVTHLNFFCKFYLANEQQRREERNFYELIVQGKPCALYLDVDHFPAADDPASYEEGMRDMLELLKNCSILCAKPEARATPPRKEKRTLEECKGCIKERVTV